jgi:hypothetical protein
MKTKYTVLTVISALGLAASLFAAEQHKADAAKVITLKSHGVAVAELRVFKGSQIDFAGQKLNYDAMTGTMVSSGGVTIHIGGTADTAVTVKADSVEMVSVEK